MTKSHFAMLAAIVSLGALSGYAAAQPYPSKPVRIIVSAAPGGPPDIRARWLAQRLSPALGQPIVVDNRPGAGGIIGTEAAARSMADGHTIALVTQGTLAINPHIYSRLGYDALVDFAPITRLSVNPFLLTVHPGIPANSVGELVKYAKLHPGQLNFGSDGIGTPPHVAGELFKRAAGIDVIHVPYKSGPQTVSDLISGRIAYTLDSLALLLPHASAGTIRALAVTSPQRMAALPDIPTIAESGLPGFAYFAWMGLAAPAGTPKDIVARLYGEIKSILRTPDA